MITSETSKAHIPSRIFFTYLERVTAPLREVVDMREAVLWLTAEGVAAGLRKNE